MLTCIAYFPNSLDPIETTSEYTIAYRLLSKPMCSSYQEQSDLTDKYPDGVSRILRTMTPRLKDHTLYLHPVRTIRVVDARDTDVQWIDIPYHRHMWYNDIIQFLDHYWQTMPHMTFISIHGHERYAFDRVDSNVKSVYIYKNDEEYVLRVSDRIDNKNVEKR